MSQEVLMVSRSSAYFHLERSYLRLAAEAAAEAAAAEDRFSCSRINRDSCYFTSFHFIGERKKVSFIVSRLLFKFELSIPLVPLDLNWRCYFQNHEKYIEMGSLSSLLKISENHFMRQFP